ncbi:MAG: AraC family transcriptional regulator ligand-binding domain-containing protein [bacterium]
MPNTNPHPDYRETTRRILNGVRNRGIEASAVLAGTGLTPENLSGKDGRVSGQQLLAVMRSATTLTQDEFIGLTRRPCKPGALEMMIATGVNSKTLKGLIEHCRDFYYFVSDDIAIEFIESTTNAKIQFSNRCTDIDTEDFLAEHYLLLLHRFLSWSVGMMIPILSVYSQLAEQPSDQRLYSYLRDDWRTRCDGNGFSFHAKYLSLPIVRTTSEVHQFFAEQQTTPPWPDTTLTWSHQTRAALKQQIEADPRHTNLDAIAARLNTTSRNLRRHLADEGTSFQDISDDLRRDIAIDKLHFQHLSIADVASELGFAEPRSFSRAFKKWTGVTPGSYK